MTVKLSARTLKLIGELHNLALDVRTSIFDDLHIHEPQYLDDDAEALAVRFAPLPCIPPEDGIVEYGKESSHDDQK